jgi:serine/threonine protein kinase
MAGTGPLNSGTVLASRYSIERLLGGGGMGVVYLARDQRLANRPCAIKEMVDHFIDQQQRLEANDYFAREADTLAQLKHQAIPAITDRFDAQNRHYLVMEYVEGRNLEEELAARGGEPLPEGLIIDVGRQLCDVLAYLHNMTPPIVYRDMKPSNVMLTSKGRVVLVDFGIARLFKAARKGTMIGTLGFAPPEQYKGDIDPRSDIYSLAATMHYMLTARDPEKFPPFSFPKLKELRPEVSSNLATAIDSALSYNVEGRPQTVEAFRDMMLYGTGISASGEAVSSKAGTAGLAAVGIEDIGELPIAPRPPRSAVSRAIGLVTFSLILAGIAFGATYVYSDPMLQMQLGIKPLIDSLPWKHEELVAEARQHPLEFQQMSLMLSSRDGTPISEPKAVFTDAEITTQKYLKWQATFRNDLQGLEGRTDDIEARFYDAGGHQLASSDQSLFVGPAQKTVDFSGVALMPDLTQRNPGAYKVALYLGDKYLAAQQFTVTQDLANKAKAASEGITPPSTSVEDAAKKAAEEEEKLAKIEQIRRKPLELQHIAFLNSTKTGTPLSAPSESFDVAKVLFVSWQIDFKNRLYKLDNNQYRVDAAYIAPDGRTLGSVNDWKNVGLSDRTVTFSGRVGNSAGGAFLPGTYTVNFYLNGQYFAQKRFEVVADTGGSPYALPPSGGSPYGSSGGGSSGGLIPPSLYGGTSSSGASLSGPTVAKGNINGLPGGGNSDLELRLRPQANGFLHGEVTIHKNGYGANAIEGFVRGSHVVFQVPYGTEILSFEGDDRSGDFSGTFESNPSGQRGTWTARAY